MRPSGYILSMLLCHESCKLSLWSKVVSFSIGVICSHKLKIKRNFKNQEVNNSGERYRLIALIVLESKPKMSKVFVPRHHLSSCRPYRLEDERLFLFREINIDSVLLKSVNFKIVLRSMLRKFPAWIYYS